MKASTRAHLRDLGSIGIGFAFATVIGAGFLAVQTCVNEERAAEIVRPVEWTPDPRDEEALREWERHGGDPAEFFRHRIPAPVDPSGAYPLSEDERRRAAEDDAEQRRIREGGAR